MILTKAKYPDHDNAKQRLPALSSLVSAQAQATRQTHTQASPSLHTPITTQSTLRGRPWACPWGAGRADGFLDLGLASSTTLLPSINKASSLSSSLHHNTVSTGTHLACCWSCEPPLGVPVPPPARGHLAQAIQSSPHRHRHLFYTSSLPGALSPHSPLS
jgi:hypothetical protein